MSEYKVSTTSPSLWTNEKFWGAVIALIVVIIAQFIPSFQLDQEAVAKAVLVIALYAAGVVVDPGAPGWKGVLQSRKFWAAVVAVVANFLTAFQIQLPYGLTYDQITDLITAIVSAMVLNFALTKPVLGTRLIR